MRMSRISFSALIAGLLFAILFSCEHQDTIEDVQKTVMKHHDKQVNQFILDKLNSNRIVMLGEPKHGQYLYKKTLIDFLNFWVDLNINDVDINTPHKICLVVEADSSFVDKLRNFLKSGNYSDVLPAGLFNANGVTVWNIYYFYALRDVLNRIENYNRQSAGNKLSIDIFGPEKKCDIETLTMEEASEYSIYHRDEDVFEKIKKYMQDHPDYKLLAYYGTGHMNSEKTMKRNIVDSGEAYYYGHYLKQIADSIGGLYRLCQTNPKSYVGDVRLAFCDPESTYVIENKYLAKNVEFNSFGRDLGEATIMRFENEYSMKRIPVIFTERHTEFFIDSMESFKEISPDFSRRLWSNVFYYFYMLSGENVVDTMDYDVPELLDRGIARWRAWYLNADHDIVAQIDDMSLLKRLIDNYVNADVDYAPWFEYLLTNMLNDKPLQFSELSIEEKGKAYYQYLEDNRTKLLCDNLIPLLMIGTEDEKVKALEVLQRETGQEFTDFRDWFEWMYREQL